MEKSGQQYYGNSSFHSFEKEDILSGNVIKINPALITIIDGLIAAFSPEQLQEMVWSNVTRLMESKKIHTFHLDINFDDYSGFGDSRPDLNGQIFTPSFSASLNKFIRSRGCFLNVHFLTDDPRERLREYKDTAFGALCFQLEAVKSADDLSELISEILDRGACASPVIEIVGSEHLTPKPKEEVFDFISPFLDKIGMLTFQVEGTASRSTHSSGMLNDERTKAYIEFFRAGFGGTIQIQGGIRTNTVSQAVKLGAEFLVCGTQIFRNKDNREPEAVIDELLMEACKSLIG